MLCGGMVKTATTQCAPAYWDNKLIFSSTRQQHEQDADRTHIVRLCDQDHCRNDALDNT